jgi:hypothetical protein
MRKLFTTDKGKSLIDTIKKKVDTLVRKGESDKAKIGRKIVSKLIKTRSGIKTELDTILNVSKHLKGKLFF